MNSRNLAGICSARARSAIRIGSPGGCSARRRSALIAYLDFFESMRYSVLDLPEYTLVQKSSCRLDPTLGLYKVITAEDRDQPDRREQTSRVFDRATCTGCQAREEAQHRSNC